ncbi:MAG: hypothetical protein HYU86_12665 [Chloroflexi bacterium]|nr:hypothetical protein [Chloroflexota bacterium]
MEQLYQEYKDKDCEFLVLYTREAHPNETYPRHVSHEQKLSYARTCQERYGITLLPVLVEDIDGEIHQAYGSMPNMVYVVDKSGLIAYKAAWLEMDELRCVLENLVWAEAPRRAEERSSYKAKYSEMLVRRRISLEE